MNKAILAAALSLMFVLPATATSGEQTITVWGTNSVDATGVITVGVAICTTAGTDTELECGSDLTNRGQGTFDVSGWNAESGTDAYRSVTVKAQLNGLRPGPATGYDLFVCADVNDDLFCSSTDGDLTVNTHSDDSGAASLTACVPEDLAAAGGDYDDLIVFIGHFVDAGNADVGTSEGAYTVTMTPGAFSSNASCT